MTMRSTAAIFVLAGLAIGAVAPHARAQDSVSSAPGLPGDAPDAYQAGVDTRQVLRYVVDLPARTSSWGNRYSLGPVAKASRSNAGGYFDQVIGATAASARFSPGAFFSSGAYALWVGTPGAGVNAPANAAPASSVAGAGRFGQRFGVAFMEFGAGLDGGFGSGDDECSVIGAMVDLQYRDPARLFVTRVAGAQNKSVATDSGTASFGLGGVDEAGNVHALADGYGMTVSTRLSTRNLLRLKLGARTGSVVNRIVSSGGVPTSLADPGALDVVRSSNTMMTVPGIISARLAGATRPVALATDLTSNLVYESAAGSTVSTLSYLPGNAGSPRGGLTFIPQLFTPAVTPGSDAGTGATLLRTDNNTTTRGLRVFTVNTNGSPDGAAALSLTLPTVAADLRDRADGFQPGSTLPPLTAHEFTNYASQASFRGSSGQVAATILPGGDLLLAATVAAAGGGSAVPQSELNYIAVARVPAAGGAPAWTIAAHTGDALGYAGGLSKAILGRPAPGAALAPIGRLARASEANPSVLSGPSISSPAMDRAGNVYFIATFGQPGSSAPIFSTGVFRANLDPATNAYQLELLAQVGDVLPGLNSGRVYQVQSLSLSDADSVDSASIFSSSTVQDQIGGAPGLAGLPYGSPATLGALVLRAKIVYDMNADGQFVDPSGSSSGSNSPDQAYNVVMALMPRFPVGDYNRSGQTELLDIFDFLNAWFATAPNADWNGNGTVDLLDIFAFLDDWFANAS